MSESLSFVSVVGGAVEILGNIFGDQINAGWNGLKLLIGDKIGWLSGAINEAIGYAESTQKPFYTYIMEEQSFEDLYRAYIWWGVRTQGWLGGDFAREMIRAIISGFAGLGVEETLSDYARISLNAYRGAKPPIGFDLIWMGEYLEDTDEDYLAFLGAISGAHVLNVANYIAQAMTWGYDMYTREMIRTVDRSVDNLEDLLLWDIDIYSKETRYWFTEGLRTYHRAITRLTAMVDHMVERALARLFELRISVTTTYLWFKDGLVDADRLLKAWDQVEAEIQMTLDNIDKVMSLLEEVVPAIDYETSLDTLVEEMNMLYETLAGVEFKRLSAVADYPFKDTIEKLTNSIKKVIAYKHARPIEINGQKAIATYIPDELPVYQKYPQRPVSITVDYLTAGS